MEVYVTKHEGIVVNLSLVKLVNRQYIVLQDGTDIPICEDDYKNILRCAYFCDKPITGTGWFPTSYINEWKEKRYKKNNVKPNNNDNDNDNYELL